MIRADTRKGICFFVLKRVSTGQLCKRLSKQKANIKVSYLHKKRLKIGAFR